MFRTKNTDTLTEAKKGISAEHGKQKHNIVTIYVWL
jgi:hypothetical protein